MPCQKSKHKEKTMTSQTSQIYPLSALQGPESDLLQRVNTRLVPDFGPDDSWEYVPHASTNGRCITCGAHVQVDIYLRCRSRVGVERLEVVRPGCEHITL